MNRFLAKIDRSVRAEKEAARADRGKTICDALVIAGVFGVATVLAAWTASWVASGQLRGGPHVTHAVAVELRVFAVVSAVHAVFGLAVALAYGITLAREYLRRADRIQQLKPVVATLRGHADDLLAAAAGLAIFGPGLARAARRKAESMPVHAPDDAHLVESLLRELARRTLQVVAEALSAVTVLARYVLAVAILAALVWAVRALLARRRHRVELASHKHN